MRNIAVAAGFWLAATALFGDQIQFGPPLACRIGEGRPCYIQSFMDRNPAQNQAQDHRCGARARDGHNGTDFALTSLSQMRTGVDVIATAPGLVTATRDGMADRPFDLERAELVRNRECGNAVIVSHADGWSTQYCHLKQGSVTVRKADQVETGTILGQVGLSGKTTFPHLHLTVRRHGELVDPFALGAKEKCGQTTADTLWRETPEYRATGLIAVGFAPSLPSYAAIKDGQFRTPALPVNSEALVAWAYAFGGQTHDNLSIEISDPDGTVIHQYETSLDAPLQLYYRASGFRTSRLKNWQAGTFTAVTKITRDGTIVGSATAAVVIQD